MQITVKEIKKVDVTHLHVDAGVRYWEDSSVNSQEDTEGGDNIPCKEGDRWRPIIDLETGVITNWEIGKTADIHYKVCDDGIYTLKDREGNSVVEIEGYVPDILTPGGVAGYGDCIIMSVGERGEIEDWVADLTGFEYEEGD